MPSSASTHRALQGFATAYLAVSIILAIFTLYLCYAIQWSGPFRDLWEFIGALKQQLEGQWDFQALAEPYGGIHRILLPKLLFYLDYRFLAGKNYLAMSVTIALHLAACAVFLRHATSIRALPGGDSTDILFLAGIVLWCFFSTTQIYNLIYISDNQVPISNALCVLAATLFISAMTQHSILRLWLSVVLTLVASLSHASALMMWPAMIVLMILRHYPLRQLVIHTIALAVMLALYVSGPDPLQTDAVAQMPAWKKLFSGLLAFIANAPGIARYIGMHLSSPVSRDYPLAGILLGYLSIFYTVGLCIRVYRNAKPAQTASLFWILIACYGIFIAVITAWGRQIYPNSASTDRYQTLVMTYWAAQLSLLYLDLKLFRQSLACLSPVLSLCLLLPFQYSNAEGMAWLSSRVTIAHTAAITGITDMDTVAATLSHPLLMDKKNLVATHNDFFRENQLGYFSEPAAHWFLKQHEHYDSAIELDNSCSGELQAVHDLHLNPAQQQLRITGRGHTRRGIANEILVLDGKHDIVGLARAHRNRGEFRPLHWRDPANSQWVGFINAPTPLAWPLVFVAISPGEACQLFTVTTADQLPVESVAE